MASRLIVIKGYDRDKYLELKAVCSYCVGRGGTGRNVDFKVDPCEYLTSRQHFFIDYVPPRIYVRDNHSTNGTLVQRGNTTIPVTGEQTEVYEGDLIVAGNTVFRVENTDEAYEIPLHKSQELEKHSAASDENPEAPMKPPFDAHPFSNEISNPQIAYSGTDELRIGDPVCPASSPVPPSPSSPEEANVTPPQSNSAAPQDYYSVVVPEIQLFHSAQVKCIACGEPITVEIAPSELQAYGYPVFMCEKCSSGFNNVRNLKDLDSYNILQELREDSMGLVYLARHKETGLLAEIRAILPRLLGEDILYLKREISVMQAVSHPNLVRMYEKVVYRDRIYLIYEYMPEGDLEHFLKTFSSGGLSCNDACRVVCDVLSGLRHCHEMGLVHGDIKPASILFKKDPHGNPSARLGDLGLAWICDNTGLSGFSSGYREARAFQAPEHTGNFRSLKPQADVYSMGILLYFLLTGSLPFSDRSQPINPNCFIPAGTPVVPLLDRNPEVPRALARIVEKSICQKPEERFQNASEMLQTILEMRF